MGRCAGREWGHGGLFGPPPGRVEGLPLGLGRRCNGRAACLAQGSSPGRIKRRDLKQINLLDSWQAIPHL